MEKVLIIVLIMINMKEIIKMIKEKEKVFLFSGEVIFMKENLKIIIFVEKENIYI